MKTGDGGLVLLVWRPLALVAADGASLNISPEMVLVETNGWGEATCRDLLEGGEAVRSATPLLMLPLAGGIAEVRLRR